MLSIFADALLIAARMEPRYYDRTHRPDREAEARRNRERMILTNVRF
jgi:hypothetical protein